MRTSITNKLLALYAILLTATGAFAATNLITNGDFETGDLTGWTPTFAASGSDLSVGAIPPAHDTLGAKFSATGSDFDSISQTFATTPGAFYTFSFFYEITNPPGGGTNNGFNVLWNGASVDPALFPRFGVISGFSPFTFTVQATGSTTTVVFEGRNDRAADFLDDVAVRAVVPDTGTSVALLAIGLIGVAATRRVLA